jgi:hypothetical protein
MANQLNLFFDFLLLQSFDVEIGKWYVFNLCLVHGLLSLSVHVSSFCMIMGPLFYLCLLLVHRIIGCKFGTACDSV